MGSKRLRKSERDVKIAFSDNEKYKHISKEERRMIEKLTQAGSSNKKLTGGTRCLLRFVSDKHYQYKNKPQHLYPMVIIIDITQSL